MPQIDSLLTKAEAFYQAEREGQAKAQAKTQDLAALEPSKRLKLRRPKPQALKPQTPKSPSLTARVAARTASELLVQAKAQAEEIEAEAHRKAAALKEAARQEGLQQGRKEAIEQFLDAAVLKRRALHHAREQLLTLVISVSEEVLGTALELHPESIVARITRALHYAANESRITIVVHPRDSDFVRHAADTAKLSPQAIAAIEIAEDKTMTRGDAKLLSSQGSIEAKLSAHLHAIGECLRKDPEAFLPDDLLIGAIEKGQS